MGAGDSRDNAPVDTTPKGPGLDREAVHALSNHLAVILGFIELVLTETESSDPRHSDLVEIRQAAHECARIVSGPHNDE